MKEQPSDLCVGSKGLREAETPATGTHHVLSALLPSIDAVIPQESAMSMVPDALMQFLWAFLGACSGLFIGLTKEGIDLFSTLGSVQGWQQIYTGTAANRSKKIDNGASAPPSLQGAISPEQAAVKQYLGTRPPELKPAQHSSRAYSNFPILGGQEARPVPAAAPVDARLPPVRQPVPTPYTQAPVLANGSPSQTVRADSLPDIFGATSLTGGKPAPRPAPVFTSIPDPAGAPAVVVTPAKGAAVGNAPNSHAQSQEQYVAADGASTPDDGSSPEAMTKPDSRMKKLSKRISSKLRSPKA